MMREGTIVDATLIAAPPSTKNTDGKRDPEMHRSKKGNDWHFGMKAHVGVDSTSGLVHTLVGTAGNVSDLTQAHALLHGDEIAALGDAGYQGVEKRPESEGKSVTWHVAMKRSKRKALPANKLGRMQEKLEQIKASVRAKVEHPFHVVKNLFRHRKTRYRGLAKNTAQLFTLFAFANLVLAGRRFAIPNTRVAS
jgi:transposase, IS5 family